MRRKAGEQGKGKKIDCFYYFKCLFFKMEFRGGMTVKLKTVPLLISVKTPATLPYGKGIFKPSYF